MSELVFSLLESRFGVIPVNSSTPAGRSGGPGPRTPNVGAVEKELFQLSTG
jgi:hypothetical protein